MFINVPEHSYSCNCTKTLRLLGQELGCGLRIYMQRVLKPFPDQSLPAIEQYRKNIGKQVETQLKDGKKIKGTLVIVKEGFFIIEEEKKIKIEGKKKKQPVTEKHTIAYDESSKVKLILKF